MDAAIFRSVQEPIRKFYKNDAKAAFLTLKAKGTADNSTVTCKVETGQGPRACRHPPESRWLGPGALFRRHAPGSTDCLRRRIGACSRGLA